MGFFKTYNNDKIDDTQEISDTVVTRLKSIKPDFDNYPQYLSRIIGTDSTPSVDDSESVMLDAEIVTDGMSKPQKTDTVHYSPEGIPSISLSQEDIRNEINKAKTAELQAKINTSDKAVLNQQEVPVPSSKMSEYELLLVLLSLGILFCIIGRNPYIYILGIWVLLTDSPKNFGFQHLNLLIPTHIKKIVGSGKINKVVNILPGCREIERREISPATMPDYLIPMVDGVYNLQTETLEPHSHFNTFLYRVNASYNDPRYYNESGEYFDAFMDRTFFNDPEGRITFQEICGIALTNISLYLKCGFFFVGEPDSGKSVALRLIESLIDDDFISHVSFQQLGNRFGVDQLNGVHLNTSGEMSTITNKEFSKFKMITGGDKLMVENKGKDGFTMINTAMLLFACNNLPIVDNPDSAYYRRMCILRFKNSIPE
ncbi:MAG: hypothetical protein J5997_05575 [Oscillospiraceae bacterium]|nr:hypothetical protein [Oscillospiraceae bacterium]